MQLIILDPGRGPGIIIGMDNRQSLAEFIRHVYERHGLEFGWHLDCIADLLEAIADGTAQPPLINLPRQVLRRPPRKDDQ